MAPFSSFRQQHIKEGGGEGVQGELQHSHHAHAYENKYVPPELPSCGGGHLFYDGFDEEYPVAPISHSK